MSVLDVQLCSKYPSEVSIFAYFSIFNSYLSGSPTITLLVLMYCLNYCVASNYGNSGAIDVGPTCWSFRVIAWQHLHLWYKAGAILWCCCFCFVVSFSLVFFVFIFLRDSNMIYIRPAEFRYYVVITILVNLGKP